MQAKKKKMYQKAHLSRSSCFKLEIILNLLFIILDFVY